MTRRLRTAAHRALDLAVALPVALLSSPVLLVAAVAVRRSMGAPVLFRQTRAGRDARPITILKLRTMTDARDAAGQLLPDEARLTRLGRFLRASSIDELPQLWNVLRGDMSLVGPRPLPMAYVPRYDERQRRRLDVRPGITGWAQVGGRNAVDWPERLAMDVWYVDHRSLLLDLRILLLTLRTLARREGISAEDHATMHEFRGTTG